MEANAVTTISTQRILGSNAHYAKLPFSSFLVVQQELGVRQIDFCLQAPHLWCDESEWENTDHINKQLEVAGITVAMVTPKPYKYAICAKAASPQGKATRRYYANCLEVAQSLRAPYMVITAEGACWDVKRDLLWQAGLETLQYLSREAEKKGITLLLTSVLGEESPLRAQAPLLNQLAEVKAMVEAVDSPALKVLLDINVAAVMGETITQWFTSFGDTIKAVRFTDGNYNGYRVWGEGCLPGDKFYRELQQVGYAGPLSLYLAGERYFDEPDKADAKNVPAVRRLIEEG